MGRRQYIKPATKKSVKASKEGPCEQSWHAVPFHRRFAVPRWDPGTQSRMAWGWQREDSQVGKIGDPARTGSGIRNTSIMTILLTKLSKIKETLFKIESGGSEGAALTHCHSHPTQEEGRIYFCPANHLIFTRTSLAGLPSGLGSRYSPTNEILPHSANEKPSPPRALQKGSSQLPFIFLMKSSPSPLSFMKT